MSTLSFSEVALLERYIVQEKKRRARVKPLVVLLTAFLTLMLAGIYWGKVTVQDFSTGSILIMMIAVIAVRPQTEHASITCFNTQPR